MAGLFKVYSAAVPTTAAMVRIATGTAIKTHLQLTAGAGPEPVIVAWGVDFETVPTAFVHAELIQTTTVAGTGATSVTPTPMRAGTVASVTTAAFGPTAEGTVAATTKVFDDHLLMSSSYAWEFSLGREPVLSASQVLRIRMTTSVTINALCWIMFEE
jgi:hypothetical protein